MLLVGQTKERKCLGGLLLFSERASCRLYFLIVISPRATFVQNTTLQVPYSSIQAIMKASTIAFALIHGATWAAARPDAKECEKAKTAYLPSDKPVKSLSASKNKKVIGTS